MAKGNLSTHSTMTNPFFQKLMNFIAIGFGSGLLRPAPGTWGSTLGLLLVYFLGNSFYWILFWMILAWVSIFFFEKSHSHDRSEVVIDEIAGIFCCFFWLQISLPILIAGFLIFRLLDITKPGPISWLDENIPGALGTLLDDIVAGALTCGVLHLTVGLGLWSKIF